MLVFIDETFSKIGKKYDVGLGFPQTLVHAGQASNVALMLA